MTKFKLSNFKIIGLIAILFLILILGWAFYFSIRSVQALKNLDFDKAESNSHQALKVVRPLSKLSFGLIPDLEFLRVGLESTPLPKKTQQELGPYLTNLTTGARQEKAVDPQVFSVLNNRFKELETLCQKSWFVKSFPALKKCQILLTASQVTTDLETLVTTLSQGDQSYLVLLQNTEEIRATGGFMGSYARLELDPQGLKELTIQDIYEPDGQFAGFVEAPPGVKKYLSSGNGLRLPDSNWHPDFPVSAQTVLSYFSFGKEQSAQGVIAITSDLLEKILAVVGDIYLPDYQQTVTAQNFTQVARADREQFFPGSKQKKHFLSILMNQLKFRFEDITLEQKKEIASLIWQAVELKELQAYSTNPDLETVFTRWGLAGNMTTSPQPSLLKNLIEPGLNDTKTDSQNPQFYLYLVESNVGINKANSNVSREVELNIHDYGSEIVINFTNNNPPNQDLDYVNYQRVYLNLDTKIESVIVDDEKITDWDESEFTSASGKTFKVVGFLVGVKAGSSQTTVIETSQPQTDFESVFIQKQAGLPVVPIKIKVGDKTEEKLLESDFLFFR